ncbi:MAG: hypothetical protein ACOH2A_11515, partial [Sphingobacteriaceae bacterium]
TTSPYTVNPHQQGSGSTGQALALTFKEACVAVALWYFPAIGKGLDLAPIKRGGKVSVVEKTMLNI